MGEVVAAAEEKREKGRKIVVAIDESEESMYALKWCLNNTVLKTPTSQDTLVLLHAKRSVLVYPGFHESVEVFSNDALTSLERRDREVGQLVLHKAHKLCNDYDVKVEERLENGDPEDVICEMVKKLEADILIMGSHGYGLLTRSVLGSVSNHCVQSATCPVLVVKMPKSN